MPQDLKRMRSKNSKKNPEEEEKEMKNYVIGEGNCHINGEKIMKKKKKKEKEMVSRNQKKRIGCLADRKSVV